MARPLVDVPRALGVDLDDLDRTPCVAIREADADSKPSAVRLDVQI